MVCRLVHLTGWLICFRFVRFGRIGTRWGRCLSVIVLNGIGWYWHLIINFLYRPQCMNNITLIQWLILSQWACWEFLGFIIGWMGKVPFASHFMDWLIGLFDPLAFVLFAWGNLGSLCTFSCSLKVILLSSWGFWKEDGAAWMGKFCW